MVHSERRLCVGDALIVDSRPMHAGCQPDGDAAREVRRPAYCSVTTAEEDFVLSAWDTAVTVTVLPVIGIVAGAV